MAKARSEKKTSGNQRQTRMYQILFIIISIVVIITFILQLVH